MHAFPGYASPRFSARITHSCLELLLRAYAKNEPCSYWDAYEQFVRISVAPCDLSRRALDFALAQRFELSVKSRVSNAVVDTILSVKRQRQLPFDRPGTFIRAPVPRSKTSCNGTTVNAATDDHASSISAGAASALFTRRRLRYPTKFVSGNLATVHTTRELSRCHACRCTRPCC